jgi:hypothetical protein
MPESKEKFVEFINEIEKDNTWDAHIAPQHYFITDHHGALLPFDSDKIIKFRLLKQLIEKLCKNLNKKPVKLKHLNSKDKSLKDEIYKYIKKDENLKARIEKIYKRDFQLYSELNKKVNTRAIPIHPPEMVEKIKNRKAYLNKRSKYNENPKMSAILLSFNHEYNVEELYERLAKSKFDEIIICEDGSVDGSMEKWVDLIEHKNHYILRSNDIHELRTYEKAIHMSEAKIFCLLQDDDVIPTDNDWLNYAQYLFKKYPKLAILGGARGRTINFDRDPTYGIDAGEIPYKNPDSEYNGRDLMFVENINIGPYFMRKDVFLELGGWDRRCSKAGEPGILFESEICYRAWAAGYQVALINIPVKLDNGDRGTIIYDNTVSSMSDAPVGKQGTRQRNLINNIALMHSLHGIEYEKQENIKKKNNRRYKTKFKELIEELNKTLDKK